MPSRAEERIVTSFKSVDEAIGWVKGKGKCKPVKAPTEAACEVSITMPRKTSDGKDISPGQTIRGSLWVLETGPFRAFNLAIVRERSIVVAPNVFLVVVKISGVEFGADGKVSSAYTNLRMTNSQGEEIFFVTIPLRYPGQDTEATLEDIDLIRNAFGIGWDYFPRQ
jgi:hypothetical protein